MPLALLIVGIVFLTASVRGTHALLFDTLKDDFTGPNNFLYWALALFIISAVGYYKPLKPLSNAFMVLIVIVLFLANQGFFAKFMEQVGATQGEPTPVENGGGGGGGLGGIIQGLLGTARSIVSRVAIGA